MKKEKAINVKVTERDLEMLEFLREEHDINISSLLRDCFRKRYKQLKNKKRQ